MRFRSAVLAAAALAAATFAHATPETVRAELLQRLQSQVPGVAVGDLARGAAAFDPELRAQVEAHAREVEAAAAAGKSRSDSLRAASALHRGEQATVPHHHALTPTDAARQGHHARHRDVTRRADDRVQVCNVPFDRPA